MNQRIAIAVLGVGCLLGVNNFLRAELPSHVSSRQLDDKEKKDEKEEKETKVDVKDLPQAVVDGVKAKMPDGAITDAEKQMEDGKTNYELDVKVGDKTYEVVVSEEGKVLKSKVEDEKDEKNEKDEKKL